MRPQSQWFREARYGLFIHYGLYSLLGRGEWVMNRERIPLAEYEKLASQFTADAFDADEICGRAAKDWGMTYAILTTKHHDGFCLYDSQQTDFTTVKTACGRDLVAEFVAACRKHGLRIGLYHTLNDWHTSPNAVDALENPADNHQPYIDFIFGQLREIMTNYGKIDTMWYDGWWPFDGRGWQAEKMNTMVRTLQPDIIFNSRNAIDGDFSTPEGHISASDGLWEACMTLNDHWGFHVGDHNWKSPGEVAEMLRQVACGRGSLLLNIGPRGDGSVPEASIDILDEAGAWLKANREAIFGTDSFSFGSYERQPNERSDWTGNGSFSASGNACYLHVKYWPGQTLVLAGVETKVTAVTELATGAPIAFTQTPDHLTLTGMAEHRETRTPVVIKILCDEPPSIYNCGGHRVPNVAHVRYDPVESEIAAELTPGG